jgi:HD-like signal output (HDOD) protein
MTRRVLFVDDEPFILQGLRHRLRRKRSSWDMLFAESGKAALEILAHEPVDVIVTDMRMPQMDGATLLQIVEGLHPRVVRIVLSGHADLETAFRAVPVAHHFLAKPTDPGVLESVIDRACNLQALINDDLVMRTVGQIEKMPALPRVYSQLLAACASQQASGDEIANILKPDAAICAKALEVVNSTVYGLPRPMTEVEEAVTYLGLNTVKAVALAVEVFRQGKPSGLSPDALRDHAFQVATVAAGLFAGRQAKEDGFVAGLLHDVGKHLLAVELPAHMEKVLEEMRASGLSMHAAEQKVWGVTHAEVGGYLLGFWGLPYPLIEAVANHHAPGRVDAKEFGILAAAHIANALVHDELDPPGPGERKTNLDLVFLEHLGVTDKIDGWRETVRRELAKAARPSS